MKRAVARRASSPGFARARGAALLFALALGFASGCGGGSPAGDAAAATPRPAATPLTDPIPKPSATPTATPGTAPAVTSNVGAAEDPRDARIRDLEREVKTLRAERLDREHEWLEYTRSIARLGAIAGLNKLEFEPAVDPAAAPLAPAVGDVQNPLVAPPPVDRDAAARARRDVEIARSLRALLFSEQVAGLELLETGRLAAGATGPVVVRTLDDRGHPTGSMCAERLRLEASIAARTLTLVLEDGYERRGDDRLPFTPPELEPDDPLAPRVAAPPNPELGVRRVVLAHVDPRPWIDAVPELFRDQDRVAPEDDGLWDLVDVRVALNPLLAQDASGGYWRLVVLGGVTGDAMRDVQLDHLDRDGRLEKKLFADRMTIRPQSKGVLVTLESGAQLRGDVKTPFLDGRFRIFLPRADLAEWKAAGLPGLSPPPAPSPASRSASRTATPPASSARPKR